MQPNDSRLPASFPRDLMHQLELFSKCAIRQPHFAHNAYAGGNPSAETYSSAALNRKGRVVSRETLNPKGGRKCPSRANIDVAHLTRMGPTP